jgi:hypothetical protein
MLKRAAYFGYAVRLPRMIHCWQTRPIEVEALCRSYVMICGLSV